MGKKAVTGNKSRDKGKAAPAAVGVVALTDERCAPLGSSEERGGKLTGKGNHPQKRRRMDSRGPRPGRNGGNEGALVEAV